MRDATWGRKFNDSGILSIFLFQEKAARKLSSALQKRRSFFKDLKRKILLFF